MSDTIYETVPKAVIPEPRLSVEVLRTLNKSDLADLCDATADHILHGGGFGWVKVPSDETLEQFWTGLVLMPNRIVVVARLDGVICGSMQLVKMPPSNEARHHVGQIQSAFTTSFARGYGLGKLMLDKIEDLARQEQLDIIELSLKANQDRARQLFEQAGYELYGTHPFYAKVEGQWINGYYYYKKLR